MMTLGRSWLVGTVLVLTGAAYGAPRAVQVYPGVWRVRLGSPERLTPMRYRSAEPVEAGLKALGGGAGQVVPNIQFRPTERGCTVELPMGKAEKFYGLGLSTKTFELSGRKAWSVPSDHPEESTNESHAPEPFYVSSQGYGVYFDTARYAAFSFGDTAAQGGNGRKVVVDIPAAHGVDVYVFAGPTPLLAVQRYNLFAGGGPTPPLWGLGIAYRGSGGATAQDILHLAKMFRDTDMPCDIFGVEPGWQTQTYSCSFLWNKTKFPDPDGFIREMHGLDYRMSFWEHPFTHPTSPIHDALAPYAGSHLVWNGLVPDFATPEARRIFVKMQTESLFSKGVDSMKIDEVDSQPFKADPWSFPDFSHFPSGLDGEQMHLLFGVLAQQTLLQPFTEKNLRTWGLVRDSGALATSLPYTVYSDSYDHACYLRGLAKSGFGSHMWTPEVRDAKTVADLVRRVQTVIFSPYAMVNCWYMKLPPWLQIEEVLSNQGKVMPQAEEATRLVREAFRLRMSLVPYLYAAFDTYRTTGMPPLRALTLDYPGDAQAVSVDDQFMFGASLMAAPFVDGVSKRTVYFPKGDWFDYYTGERIHGGQSLVVEKLLDQMPLYVKDQTLLPVAEPVNHVDGSTTFSIHMRVYGDHPADASLVEDDGESLDYLRGAQTRVNLTWHAGSGSVTRSGKFGRHRVEVVSWDVVGAR